MSKDPSNMQEDTTNANSNINQSSTHVEINHSSSQETRVGDSKVSTSSPKDKGTFQDDSGLQARIDELTADLQRIQADFVNFRRRRDEERGEFLSLAKQDVIIQLLPLLDNVGRALAHVPSDLQSNPWALGVAQISKQADEMLKNLGVTKIETVGHPFDPNLHEAIGFVQTNVNRQESNAEAEIVVEELQPGYKMGERVIRHAMVKVSKQ